ncbi:MAG: phytoene desaturase family protein [bacterium]
MTYDVIIIGAGMSGIAAGIRLAHYQKKVCILEKHYRPGGLNSFYSLEGRKFDVGLHAMTNYVPRGAGNKPLTKLLRQLRLKHEDFGLCEQVGSAVSFPGTVLHFSNDFSLLEREIREKFPRQTGNFRKLCKHLADFNELDLNYHPVSARRVVGSYITDPLLVEMLFCPLSYYGSARENDMDFDQFAIMFKSIFQEGFARPEAGVRRIINVLLKKYKRCGGEMRLRTGVKRISLDSGSRVQSVTLENGDLLETRKILSCAGYLETMNLAGIPVPKIKRKLGKLSFVEMIYVLDTPPSDLGLDKTIIFYNDSDRFAYQRPLGLVDIASGVICCPSNFQFETPLPDNMVRVTHQANYDLWDSLSPEEYLYHKQAWRKESLEKISTVIPDFSDSIIFTDMFTPLTIHKYTGHLKGAVYGSPEKIKNGVTPVENLFICGTDQGFLGIVGAMLSGISMANLHALR